MTPRNIFGGFFSYAHRDAETDPEMFNAFSVELEKLVNAKLVNASFRIFRDKDGLRTGVKFDPKLEAELREADILILLFTPSWIVSEYCRREFLIFEQVESARPAGEYVVPIIARGLGAQEIYLRPEQKNIYERIKRRQHFAAGVNDFISQDSASRKLLIDKLADDIVGMIDRIRLLDVQPSSRANLSIRTVANREFSFSAHDLEKVDFITGGKWL
jgi:hypothetical protein